MKKQFDEILVVDVESTCWEGKPPHGQESDIIEIGICPVNIQTMTLGKAESIMVRPERSQVSTFCTQLTTITPEMAAAGTSLREACDILMRKYRSESRVWASYGDYDRNQFYRCCKGSTRYPFSGTHMNVKTLFALMYRLPREIGMDGALKHLNWELEGTHHRAGDDAQNIAKVLCYCLKGKA